MSAGTGVWHSERNNATRAERDPLHLVQMWIPPGFGHAFLVLSAAADFLYKTTDYWIGEHDRTLRWDDPTLAIDWPLDGAAPIVSARDASAPALDAAETFP